MFAADSLRDALSTLGALLEDRGIPTEIVVIGGGGLLLAGLIQRPTEDLDALAFVRGGSYDLARPFPAPLREAISDVANLLGLAPDWLNPGPTDQVKHGLPLGFATRTTRLVFGGLTLHVASRFDQICLKLYAAVDDAPSGKHFADLVALEPTHQELREAKAWVATQDIGIEFQQFIDAVIAKLEARRGR